MTTSSSGGSSIGALREIPYMGVIYVVHEASKLGFFNGNPDWCNLGQGQPEVGPMEGAPPRLQSVELHAGDHAYGPLGGTLEARKAVADHYNRLFRRGKASQYGPENVSIASGGRLALTRIFAALDAGNVGYQIPDYTAYEDQLWYHMHRFEPVLLKALPEEGFKISAARLAAEQRQHKLTAFVVSNPCNPTGSVVEGAELAAWVELARGSGLTLVLDEFYSHFVYRGDAPGEGPVSAAAHVGDVNRDPVLLVDGLTKCFRYPGWRCGWVVGPADMIEVINRAASALDGGPSQITQRAMLQVLAPARADQEVTALRVGFAKKRKVMHDALARMGISASPEPSAAGVSGTFYIWADLSALPAPINTGVGFFRAALERKVMTVPGEFFDVNPGKRRAPPSPYASWARFSFGPSMDNLQLGLDRLSRMVAEHKS